MVKKTPTRRTDRVGRVGLAVRAPSKARYARKTMREVGKANNKSNRQSRTNKRLKGGLADRVVHNQAGHTVVNVDGALWTVMYDDALSP
jgi:membrane protein implicated in regulation of membrane protease activity